jgi:hypothetical protein
MQGLKEGVNLYESAFWSKKKRDVYIKKEEEERDYRMGLPFFLYFYIKFIVKPSHKWRQISV